MKKKKPTAYNTNNLHFLQQNMLHKQLYKVLLCIQRGMAQGGMMDAVLFIVCHQQVLLWANLSTSACNTATSAILMQCILGVGGGLNTFQSNVLHVQTSVLLYKTGKHVISLQKHYMVVPTGPIGQTSWLILETFSLRPVMTQLHITKTTQIILFGDLPVSLQGRL